MRKRTFILSGIVAAALSLLVTPVHAQTASATVCADGTTSTEVGKGLCVGHGGVKAKSTSTVAKHVTCTDGTVADPGKDACAGHGGVKSRTTTTSSKTVNKTSTEDKNATDAIALCKDGLYSHADTRAAACHSHGGVQKFLKP